jgi:hypothetical protein
MVVDLGPPPRSTNYVISFFGYLRSVFQSTNWILLKGIYTWRHSYFTIFWYKEFVKFSQKLKKILKFTLEIQHFPTFCSKYSKKIVQKNHGSEDSFPIYESNLVEEFFAFWIRLMIAFFS